MLFTGSACSAQTALVSASRFQITVPVANQKLETKQNAFIEGMNRLLYILSGDSRVQNDASVIKEQKNVMNYIVRYSYTNIPKQDSSTASPEEKSNNRQPGSQLALQINFDPKAITQLLVSRKYPAWINTRPKVLVWFAQQENLKSPSFLSDSSFSPVKKSIVDAFAGLDIPVIFPLMDLKDMSIFSQSKEDKPDIENILKASERYTTPAVLVVSAQPAEEKPDDSLSGSATFILQGNTFEYTFSSVSTQQMAEALSSFVITPMVKFYTKPRQDKRYQFVFSVKGVKTMGDFNGVEQYLQKNPFITKVTPKEVSLQTASFTVLTSADITQIVDFFDIRQHLILISEPDKSDSPSISDEKNLSSTPVYVFRWYPEKTFNGIEKE
ncbi:MAG: DUF2066 domain-containing protein [Endozoicomonadaceae bacterium]|nr:DUF2066 domain-containing protein [Endozoicomonadaceae bacterium]